jgi:hypothetical protein
MKICVVNREKHATSIHAPAAIFSYTMQMKLFALELHAMPLTTTRVVHQKAYVPPWLAQQAFCIGSAPIPLRAQTTLALIPTTQGAVPSGTSAQP